MTMAKGKVNKLFGSNAYAFAATTVENTVGTEKH